MYVLVSDRFALFNFYLFILYNTKQTSLSKKDAFMQFSLVIEICLVHT